MSASQTFLEQYVEEISASLLNNYTDNYDYLRFGKLIPSERDWSWKGAARNLLKKRGYVSVHSLKDQSLAPFRLIAPYADRFQWLYSHLADTESRELLVRVLAFRALGHTKVKLPLSTPAYWQSIWSIDQLADKADYIQAPFMGLKLFRIHLDSLGFPIDAYLTAKGTYTQFGLQQYRCLFDGGAIQADLGDYVIDGGACWGDTALYFAHRVGMQGKVFSYEFRVFAE